MKLNQLQTTQINGLDETEIVGMRQTSKTKMQKIKLKCFNENRQK